MVVIDHYYGIKKIELEITVGNDDDWDSSL